MAAISVRGLDEAVASRLKSRAARHGRSMEAEARAVIIEAVADEAGERVNLAEAIHERFAAIGGVDLETPPRHDMPRAAGLA
jgi:plasmid stability protein